MIGGAPWWVPGGWRMSFPQMGILPELFGGRGCPVEAQGCRMMGDSHDRNTPGPLDPSREYLINQGVPPGVGLKC